MSSEPKSSVSASTCHAVPTPRPTHEAVYVEKLVEGAGHSRTCSAGGPGGGDTAKGMVFSPLGESGPAMIRRDGEFTAEILPAAGASHRQPQTPRGGGQASGRRVTRSRMREICSAE